MKYLLLIIPMLFIGCEYDRTYSASYCKGMGFKGVADYGGVSSKQYCSNGETHGPYMLTNDGLVRISDNRLTLEYHEFK